MEPAKVKRLIKPLRVFSVKHPQLKKIRYALRTVIKLAVLDEYRRLTHLIHLYEDKQRNGYGLTPTQKSRKSSLHHKRTFLYESFKNSIIVAKDDNRFSTANTNGDRVRYTDVTEWEKKPWNEFIMKQLNGARFVIKQEFYSLEEYEKYSQYFTETFIQAKKHALNNCELCITFRESFKRKYPSISDSI